MEKFRRKLRDGEWHLGLMCAALSLFFVRTIAFIAGFDVYQEGHYLPTMLIEVTVSVGILATLWDWVHRDDKESEHDRA